ncbi:MAG: VTT domain-containing protein [Dehalococcoidia bacterium]|nr:VTT domain-containing protein [Dehalococcoidia bacterium]
MRKVLDLFKEIFDSFKPNKTNSKKAVITLILTIVGFIGLSMLTLRFTPNLEKLSQYGYLGVFLISLISSATIFVPLPGMSVILTAATIWNPILVALIASVGYTLGEITAYYAGRGGRAMIIKTHQEAYEKAEGWMEHYGGLTIFLFAFIPVFLFDMAGIAAGALGFPLKKFLLYCWIGRLPRSFIEIYLGFGLFHLISPLLFQ